jgi:hypothetical protein
MKIVFNLINVGIANNGGSRTLIRCAETLCQLGHEVIMVSNNKHKYTWHKVDKRVNCDVLIATGYNSVSTTLRSRAKRKFYFVRGLETWVTSESKLIESFKSMPCIVNSEWLKSYMDKRGVSSELIYPGLDFDLFYKMENIRERAFGALYHRKHKTKRHCDAIKVAHENKDIPLRMLNKDLINPSPAKLNRWYNTLKVWFAPTELEGLHNPPMEASLAGCTVVCTDHPHGGMNDYAKHGETALIYKSRDMVMAASYIKELIDDENKRLRLNENMIAMLKEKIGTRKGSMRKLLKVIT